MNLRSVNKKSTLGLASALQFSFRPFSQTTFCPANILFTCFHWQGPAIQIPSDFNQPRITFGKRVISYSLPDIPRVRHLKPTIKDEMTFNTSRCIPYLCGAAQYDDDVRRLSQFRGDEVKTYLIWN